MVAVLGLVEFFEATHLQYYLEDETRNGRPVNEEVQEVSRGLGLRFPSASGEIMDEFGLVSLASPAVQHRDVRVTLGVLHDGVEASQLGRKVSHRQPSHRLHRHSKGGRRYVNGRRF